MLKSGESTGSVLVVGASGKLGRATTGLLLREGYRVRAMTRDPSKAPHLGDLGIEVFEADLRDPDSLSLACIGMDFVIASAHAALEKGSNCPESVDGQGHRDLIDAAREAGVRHFSYASAQNVGAEHPVDFFRLKFGTEQYLQASGLSYTIIRGAAFMETQHEVMGDTIVKKKKAFLFGRGNVKANYVSVVDMACFLTWSLSDERLLNRLLNVGGPENLTQSEVVDIYEKACGFLVKRSGVPVPVLRAVNFIVGPFHPVVRRLSGMGVLIATVDTSFDTRELLAEFDWPLTPFAESVRSWQDSGGWK